jgi:hypothetical protein
MEERETEGEKPEPPSPLAGSQLDTPEARAAWGRWVKFRSELRKPLTASTTSATLKSYATRGPAALIAAIDHTILRGWQGLRDPDVAPSGTAPQSSLEDLLERYPRL